MQPHRVNLSIASPSEIERTAQRLVTIRESFLNTGSLELWTPRPLILDSWQRCRTLHVDPSRRCAPLAVAREAQLVSVREANDLLIRAAQPVINRLLEFLSTSGYVIVLSDVQGCLLEIVGDLSVRRRLERIDFMPGGNWSEAAAGTNAIGTALADGHIVQLMAAEHYCDGWQDLTCTATPIRHPLTNEVIGILDVTGNYRLIRPFLTSLLAKSALEIRQILHSLCAPPPSREESRHLYAIPASLFSTCQATTTTVNKMVHSTLSIERSESDKIMADIQQQFDVQERRVYDAERLAAATGIISASLDLDVTIEKVNEQVMHLLRVERVDVVLFNENDEYVSQPVQTTSLSPRPGQPHILSTLLQGTRAIMLIQERGEPVVIDDTLNSPLIPLSFVTQTGMRALLLLPLVTARGVSGCIAISRTIPFPWTIEEIRLGLAIATQSATSIENARLFETLQQHNRHMHMLNAIAQMFNTLPDPSHHMDLTLQRITEILNVDAGMILLLDQADDRLMPVAQWKFPKQMRFDGETRLWDTFHTLALRIVAQREPAIVCLDSGNEPAVRQALRVLGFYSLVVVALATGDSVLGVLLVARNDRHNMGQEDLKFFSTIGQQLGLALRNAQLRRSASEMEALREADRLKSGFLAAVSHDLRSPLTAIHASAESLLDADGIQSVAGREHLLHNITGQAKRLGLLVDQLLDLSRIEAGILPLDCDWIELSVLIDDTIKDFERLHCGFRIEKALAPGLPLQYIDPDRLAQVVWNLLENAYKYSPQSSPVQVEVHMQDHEVLISIADRGPGIPRGEHDKVFQRFYRLDGEQRLHTQGSGLGLAICKGIVEAHEGRIWVEDREGGGCVFLIALCSSESVSVGFEALEEQKLLVEGLA